MARICAFSAWPVPVTVFLTEFGAYSATSNPRRAGTSERDAACLPELQRRTGIDIHEGFLDCGLRRLPALRNLLNACKESRKPLSHRLVRVRLDCAASHEGKTRAIPIDDAPAEIAEAGVQPKDARDLFLHEAADSKFRECKVFYVAGCGQGISKDRDRVALGLSALIKAVLSTRRWVTIAPRNAYPQQA